MSVTYTGHLQKPLRLEKNSWAPKCHTATLLTAKWNHPPWTFKSTNKQKQNSWGASSSMEARDGNRMLSMAVAAGHLRALTSNTTWRETAQEAGRKGEERQQSRSMGGGAHTAPPGQPQ